MRFILHFKLPYYSHVLSTLPSNTHQQIFILVTSCHFFIIECSVKQSLPQKRVYNISLFKTIKMVLRSSIPVTAIFIFWKHLSLFLCAFGQLYHSMSGITLLRHLNYYTCLALTSLIRIFTEYFWRVGFLSFYVTYKNIRIFSHPGKTIPVRLSPISKLKAFSK